MGRAKCESCASPAALCGVEWGVDGAHDRPDTAEALYVVERYRLLDYEAAKEGLERDAKENFRVPGNINPNYRAKHLQNVCAGNRQEYYNNKDSDVPTAVKPDF